MAESKPLPTSEDIGKLFESQAKREKKNVVQEVGNQNPWKDELPPEEVLNIMADSLQAEEIEHGARTIPSRPIAAVDRSDRLGEDRKMNDKIVAERVASRPLTRSKRLLKQLLLLKGSATERSGKMLNLKFQICLMMI